MSILALIDNNEEFFNKKFECEMPDSNKKTDRFKMNTIPDIPIKKDQNDPQGIESEAAHFKKQGYSQQMKSIGMKSAPSDFFNNNFWEKKEEDEEEDKEKDNLMLEADEDEILEDLGKDDSDDKIDIIDPKEVKK